MGGDWDEPIAESIRPAWEKWIDDLPKIKQIAIPRCYFPDIRDKTTTIELHVFSDASQQAKSVVIYARFIQEDIIAVKFVMGRSWVTPLKPVSIPRLELQAALLGTRLATFVQENHTIKFTRVQFWTDSSTVLCWLRSDARKFPTFVANRIGEIEESTNAGQWRWVPTKENPAGDATRNNTPADLSSSCRWLNGPNFLKLAENEWPKDLQLKKNPLSNEDLELKSELILVTTTENQMCFPDMTRFSNWNRLIRSTAYLLRYFQKCRKLIDVRGELNPDEICNAEIAWLKISQQSSFQIEILCIQRKKELPKSICKNYRAQPHPPLMSELPEIRVTKFTRAFTHVGMDGFGPIEIKRGRCIEKRYGLVLTCLSTRAIHIELLESLSTDSAILAIRRFISRRGCPSCIYSDNGTNFRGAERELRQAMDELDRNRIKAELTSHKTDWKFIPPRSPHMGGAWERLVRSIKVALKLTLKELHPKEETLRTLLCEAENIVNSRPITHVSVDPNDMEALTPNHFLIHTSSSTPTPGEFSDTDLLLRKQWKISQRLSDIFWQRWVKEYLPTLHKRQKWNIDSPPVKVGDVVIIADDQFPRNTWPKGIVVKVYPGRDGRIRVVDVQTNTGTYRRPSTKIIVLDVLPKESEEKPILHEGSMCTPSPMAT
ncbi:unnamed protein product [Allacma fusca]|uniref:Integrase catalytic domain-containing protein n=1 Tax=Allacma fusca TaxID=39272 RepID=A0A8J2LJ72_9HEXA|nr:unnamed protein product [Allacma fusca]